jgi:septin family protein
MKLRSIFLAATILALSPTATLFAQAQTPPVISAPGGGDARMHEAWQRFEQEQAEHKQKFEAEQAEREQRFEQMQAQRKAEFQQRMQEWAQKRAERHDENKSWQNKPVAGGAPVNPAPAPTAPVAPVGNAVQ